MCVHLCLITAESRYPVTVWCRHVYAYMAAHAVLQRHLAHETQLCRGC